MIVVVSGGTESNCHCLFRVYVFSSSFVDFTIFRSLTGTVLRICISSALTSALLLLKAGFSTKSNIPPVRRIDEKNFDAQCDLADFCNLLNMVMKLGIKLFCIIVNSHTGANILYLFLYFCQIFKPNISSILQWKNKIFSKENVSNFLIIKKPPDFGGMYCNFGIFYTSISSITCTGQLFIACWTAEESRLFWEITCACLPPIVKLLGAVCMQRPQPMQPGLITNCCVWIFVSSIVVVSVWISAFSAGSVVLIVVVGCVVCVSCWQPQRILSTQQIPTMLASCFRCFMVIV